MCCNCHSCVVYVNCSLSAAERSRRFHARLANRPDVRRHAANTSGGDLTSVSCWPGVGAPLACSAPGGLALAPSLHPCLLPTTPGHQHHHSPMDTRHPAGLWPQYLHWAPPGQPTNPNCPNCKYCSNPGSGVRTPEIGPSNIERLPQTRALQPAFRSCY